MTRTKFRRQLIIEKYVRVAENQTSQGKRKFSLVQADVSLERIIQEGIVNGVIALKYERNLINEQAAMARQSRKKMVDAFLYEGPSYMEAEPYETLDFGSVRPPLEHSTQNDEHPDITEDQEQKIDLQQPNLHNTGMLNKKMHDENNFFVCRK